MSIRLPSASALTLACTLLCVAGTTWAQAPAPPEREAPQHLTRSCGGFLGTPCPNGQLCLDDPGDDCDPDQGGADCIGVCVKENECKPPSCDYDDPRKSYVSKSPEQCAAIQFLCAQDYRPFFDDCGCGCELARGQQ